MAKRSGTSFSSGFYLGLVDDVSPNLKKMGKNYANAVKKLKGLNGQLQGSMYGMFLGKNPGGKASKASKTPLNVGLSLFSKRLFPLLTNIRSHLNASRTMLKSLVKNTSLNAVRRNGAILARQIARALRGTNATVNGSGGAGGGNIGVPPAPPTPPGGGGGPSGNGPEPLTWALIGHGISQMLDVVQRLSHTVGFGEKSTNVGQRFGQTFSGAQNALVGAQIGSNGGGWSGAARTDSVFQSMLGMNRSAMGGVGGMQIAGMAAFVDEANDMAGEAAKTTSALMKLGISGLDAVEDLSSISNTLRDAKIDAEMTDITAHMTLFSKHLRVLGMDQRRNAKATRDMTHAYVAFEHVLADSGFIDALVDSTRDPVKAITTAAMFGIDPDEYISNPASILKSPAFRDMLGQIGSSGGPTARLMAATAYGQATGMDAQQLVALSSTKNNAELYRIIDAMDRRKGGPQAHEEMQRRQIGAEDYATAGGRYLGAAMNNTGLTGIVNLLHQLSIGNLVEAASTLFIVGKAISFIGSAFKNVFLGPMTKAGPIIASVMAWTGKIPLLGKGITYVAAGVGKVVPWFGRLFALAPAAAGATATFTGLLGAMGTWAFGILTGLATAFSSLMVAAAPGLGILGLFSLAMAGALRIATPFFSIIKDGIKIVFDFFKTLDVGTMTMMGPALVSAGAGFGAFAVSVAGGMALLTAATAGNKLLAFFGLAEADPIGAFADKLSRLAAAATVLKGMPANFTIPLPTISGSVTDANANLDAVEALYERAGRLKKNATLSEVKAPVIPPADLRILLDDTLAKYGDQVVTLLSQISANTKPERTGITAAMARGGR